MKKIQLIILFILGVQFCSNAQVGNKIKSVQNTSLVGIWQNSEMGFEMTLILNKDGSGEFDGEAISYTNDSKTLHIKQEEETISYLYDLNGYQLKLWGGDLDAPILFQKNGTKPLQQPQTPSTPKVQNTPKSQGTEASKLIGTWTGNGEEIEFRPNQQCTYLGQTFGYNTQNGSLTILANDGSLTFDYQIQGNVLIFTTNGQTVKYTKKPTSAKANNKSNTATSAGQNNRIAHELVGKWCYVNVNQYNNGGSSTEECIVLNGDGTYQYGYESSRSVNTETYYGGTNSADSDSGKWWVQGNSIYYNSQQGKGQGSYQLQKINHPKTNDPMIVLDGKTYVTQYQKNPW